MAVQDGYGKVSGLESLVFAYDLKDTTNSFKGQPATNIFLSGNPNGQGSAVEIIQTNYFLGKVIDSGVVYRSYVINPAQSDTGTYYNNGGINMGSMVFPQLNPSTRYIQISFDYYGVTPYRRFCCSGTGLNGYLGVTSTDSTADTYGWDTTYSPGSGDDWNNDASRMGYWQKISLIVALRGDKNPSNIWALYIYMDAATQGDGYFANMIFTEHATYPSGPIRWTSGTRSNTQGLLDLTGNNSIDLSNVSFDSNAKMVFDGTNDYIDTGYDLSWNNTNSVSIEFIIKRSGTGGGIIGKQYPEWEWSFYLNGEGIRLVYWDSGGSHGNDMDNATSQFMSDVNKYYHVVYTWDRSKSRWYVNGVLDSTFTALNPSTNQNRPNNVMIGGNIYVWADSYASCEIPMVKFFNKQLTPTEITNNYLKYKRQYGLT
jgi:hypothetical protein